jgi:hypothetical protein
MVDSSCTDLLDELNTKRRMVRLWPVALLATLAAFFASPALLLPGLAVTAACGWWDRVRKTAVLNYELDAPTAASYKALQDAFDEMARAKRHWHVAASEQAADRKRAAGAANLLNQTLIRLRKAAPSYIKTNIAVPIIPVGKQSLCFFPDRLFVFERGAVGVVPYAGLTMKVRTTRFIEEGRVPEDAQTVGSTWKHPNKNGGPDRRFRDNPRIPIVEYEQIWFESASGLNEVIQVSCVGAAARFAKAVHGLAVHP